MGVMKLRHIGSSQGFVIPKTQLTKAGFSQEDEYEVIVSNNCISIIKRKPHHSKWKFDNPKLSKEDKAWLSAELEDEE